MLKKLSARLLACAALLLASVPAWAVDGVTALPDQVNKIRLSNHDVNHFVCVGSDVDDVKFSAEKAISVESNGSNAWVKFLVKETEDAGRTTRTYVTAPSEFFVTCGGTVYSLYSQPADIPAQTVQLVPGASQKAKANEDLLAALPEEERGVSISLAVIQDNVPASFSQVATAAGTITLQTVPGAVLTERRRFAIEGSGLAVSEYIVEARAPLQLNESMFLNVALGASIADVTLDRLNLAVGETARLVIVRRGGGL